jgi:hypothetical protein
MRPTVAPSASPAMEAERAFDGLRASPRKAVTYKG